MKTVFVLLIIWSGSDIAKTHNVFGTMHFCMVALAEQLRHPKGDVVKATCKPKRVKRGEAFDVIPGVMKFRVY